MASSFRKLLSRNNHASSSSSSSSSSSASTINSREIMTKISSFNQEISKNQLPHIDLDNIYKIGTFDFKTAYSIKEHEQTLSLQNEFEEIKLLSSIALDKYKQKGFNYLHFGLIQVAIKPLSRTGIDSPILMLLRDKTLLKYEDSLLGAVQSNLCNGAVYFNCAPNFQVSLHDPTILNTLVLNIHLPEMTFQNNRHGYLLLYRIYFKQSTSEFNPRCLLQDSKGETTILAVHSNDTPTATYAPKQLKWNEITIPDQWKIDITQPPRNFEQRNISKIFEQRDGKILLQFGSFRDPLPPRISSYHSRASFSEYRTGQTSTESETESVNQDINQENSIRFKAPIAEPNLERYPTSPTLSDFKSINVITKEFEIDKQYIRKDFYSIENIEKRNWYFNTFSKQQVTEFREIWYNYMKTKGINIPFFTWFETYSNTLNINYPFKTINTSTSLSQTWEQVDGKKVKSIHPPLTDLKINTANRQILATPFKTGANKDDKEPVIIQDIKSVYQQNNYQSQLLHTISKQVDSIDSKINNENYKKEKPIQDIQYPLSSVSTPIFKPITRQVKFPENEILKTIATRLDNIDKGKQVNIIDEDDNESLQSIELSSDDLEINRIKNKSMKSNKPYYPRHTPPDLLFEEHHKYSARVYDGEGIYEWNIDGKSEYEIMNLFQQMGMAAIAYKAKGSNDSQACTLLVTGFNGTLKYWWDNSLDSVTQNSILNHVEIRRIEDPDGFIIEEEYQNAVEVLIHTLTMHFIGNPAEELESKKIILTNLRCPTLGDFKWYKDVFITNIFQRNDCNQPFWKERFISGLPSFFAEKVINKLKDYSGGQPIPWNTVTYGQLFAFVKKEGLAICQEQKDKKRDDKFKIKTSMGLFCKQYGYEMLNPPSRIKRLKNKQKRFKSQKYYQNKKFNRKSDNQYYSKNKKYKPENKQKIVCWNCKRSGHKSTDCKMKKKINEIFQDQPDIQEKLRKLLISESELSEETDTDYSINEIGNSSDSSSESQELSDNLCNCKEINVILKNSNEFTQEKDNPLSTSLIKNNLQEEIFNNLFKMGDPKQKKPMSASDYVKNQPHLQGKPLINQNSFSALAEFPPLSYSNNQEKGQSSNTTQNPIPKITYRNKNHNPKMVWVPKLNQRHPLVPKSQLLSLPDDIIHKILLKAGEVPYYRFLQIKNICPKFGIIMQADWYKRELDLWEMETSNWINPAYNILHNNCLALENPSAMFITGIQYLFRDVNIPEGLHLIQQSANQGYDLAVYVNTCLQLLIHHIIPPFTYSTCDAIYNIRKKLTKDTWLPWHYPKHQWLIHHKDQLAINTIKDCKCIPNSGWHLPFKGPRACPTCFWKGEAWCFAEKYTTGRLIWP